jgi:hypothetical protein
MESVLEESVSTRVIGAARLNATCRQELCQLLMLSVDPASELSRLNSIIGSRTLSLPDLQRLINAPVAVSVLSTLASAEFSRVRAHLAGGSRSALETTATDLQTELAETLAIATTIVTAATRAITATTFAQSGLELGYTVSTHQGDSATCVELRRGQEIVVVGVHDGGSVEVDHGGLAEATCEERQLQLERAVQRHGVDVARLP